MSQQEGKATKHIIANAIVGDAIGGMGGAVIGATTAASTESKKRNELSQKHAAAEKKYRDALENSVK